MSQKTNRPFHIFKKLCTQQLQVRENVGFEKALGAVKVIKDQIQYRSQSLLNLAHDYFNHLSPHTVRVQAVSITAVPTASDKTLQLHSFQQIE